MGTREVASPVTHERPSAERHVGTEEFAARVGSTSPTKAGVGDTTGAAAWADDTTIAYETAGDGASPLAELL
jgi:hypothetical protein